MRKQIEHRASFGRAANKYKRFIIGGAVAVSAALILAACGGGGADQSQQAPSSVSAGPPGPGGPASAPAPATILTLSASSMSCVADAGAKTCSVSLTATTNNAAVKSLSITGSDGEALTAQPNTAVAVSPAIGQVTYQATGGGATSNAVTVAVTCAKGVNQATGACMSPVLLPDRSYDVIMAIGSWPYIIDKDGFHKSANKTSVTRAAIPISVCLGAEEVDADGMYPLLCKRGDNFQLDTFALNPVDNSIWDYDKNKLPPGYEFSYDKNVGWSFGPKWHGCQRYCSVLTGDWGTPPASYTSTWAWDGNGGLYFTPDGGPFPGLDVGANEAMLHVFYKDTSGKVTDLGSVPGVPGGSGGYIIPMFMMRLTYHQN
ncbi:hypothetical protein KGM48_00870 [Patescibacteria group bacterium]|nr:hypothetical protein [Patescibacteria group bacterium]